MSKKINVIVAHTKSNEMCIAFNYSNKVKIYYPSVKRRYGKAIKKSDQVVTFNKTSEFRKKSLTEFLIKFDMKPFMSLYVDMSKYNSIGKYYDEGIIFYEDDQSTMLDEFVNYVIRTNLGVSIPINMLEGDD